MNNNEIIIYSLPECDRCKVVKQTLNNYKIKYTEINDRERMKKINLKEVPAISVNGTIIKEYDKIIDFIERQKLVMNNNELTVEQWLGEDNQLGIDIWRKKYQRDNETFEKWLNRVSGNNNQVKDLIFNKKFLFGGRILSNRGVAFTKEKTSYSNCYVISPPQDTIESIYDTCKRLARTYSYGGGCGIDISNLAPTGARVRNQAKETSGAVSFMDTFSQVTEQIGQNGRRK